MIYTKSGDDGTTSLIGGRRVRKDDPRVEAYGTVDELNAHLGLLVVMTHQRHPDIAALLTTVQRDLFVIQALLAADDAAQSKTLPQVTPQSVEFLEHNIDKWQSALPPLTDFILPGGDETASQAHIARCVCRRTERRIVSLASKTELPEHVTAYINRLSDFLFVLARRISQLEGYLECYVSTN